MTTDEIQRQKADTLLAHQETEQLLEHLKVKAAQMGERLMTFGAWMRDNPATMVFRADQAHHGFNVQQTPLQYMTIFEASQYFSVAEEIRETTEKLRQLNQRKQQLGLK